MVVCLEEVGELGSGRRLSLTLPHLAKSFLIISPPPGGGDTVCRGIYITLNTSLGAPCSSVTRSPATTKKEIKAEHKTKQTKQPKMTAESGAIVCVLSVYF